MFGDAADPAVIHVYQQYGHTEEFPLFKPHLLQERRATAFEFDKAAFHFKQIAKLRTSEKIRIDLAHHKSALLPASRQHAVVEKYLRACALAKIDIPCMIDNASRVCVLIIDSYFHVFSPILGPLW